MNKSVEEVKKYYDTHTLGKLQGFLYGNPRVERAWQTISTWQAEEPKNVLEIGCGIGDISWRFSKKWPNSNVKAFDISESSIEIAKKLFAKNNLSFESHSDINDIKLNEKVDLIFMIDVYEHVQVSDRRNFLDFFKNTLSQNGLLFISCPTPRNLEWLKKNKPNGLQPVDEEVTINDVLDIANYISRSILLYKEVSVWNVGDYFHAIIGNRKYEGKFPDVDIMYPEKGLRRRIKEMFSKPLSTFSLDMSEKESLVIGSFGKEMIVKVKEYRI
jgi:trans-aconitate methyltransferase